MNLSVLAARLLADANVAWAAVRADVKRNTPAAEGRLMDALMRACKETVKVAQMLTKALLAPKGHAQTAVGQQVLDAANTVSHELVEGLYDVLQKAQEQSDPNQGGTGAHLFFEVVIQIAIGCVPAKARPSEMNCSAHAHVTL